MNTEVETLIAGARAFDDAAHLPEADAATRWLGPLLRLGARMASAGLTPEHITRIDARAEARDRVSHAEAQLIPYLPDVARVPR